MITCEMSSTLSTIKTYYGSQEYICGLFQGPFYSFQEMYLERNLIIYYVNYIQFYLYINPKCYFYVL